MFLKFSFGVLVAFTFFILFFFHFDAKRKKKKHDFPHISFLIPCYNDEDTIVSSIESIYKSYPRDKIQLIVINDKSTDGSVEKIRSLSRTYDFLFLDQKVNTGKAAALNMAVDYAIYDILCFLDADVVLNKKALTDMLDRLATDTRIAAVSSPYYPLNKGFWPFLQAIEYTMLKYLQGCYNITSALAIRGGCILVRKDPFIAVGKFSPHMIIEDMDLALKLNKAGRRVQQAQHTVFTKVPDTRKRRRKQKIRRTSGSVQCLFHHFFTFMKNPVHLIFVTIFSLYAFVGTLGIVKELLIFGQIVDFIITLFHITTFTNGMSLVSLFYGDNAVARTVRSLAFTLFSLPYVLPLQEKSIGKKLGGILLYMLFYMPLYCILSVYAFGIGVYKYYKLKPGMRAR